MTGTKMYATTPLWFSLVDLLLLLVLLPLNSLTLDAKRTVLDVVVNHFSHCGTQVVVMAVCTGGMLALAVLEKCAA